MSHKPPAAHRGGNGPGVAFENDSNAQKCASAKDSTLDANAERAGAQTREDTAASCGEPSCSTKHKQVHVCETCIDDEVLKADLGEEGATYVRQLLEVQVDEELAPLIRALWLAAIPTVMSCQENKPGWAWIMFPSSAVTEGFLDIVAPPEEEIGTLSERARHRWDRRLFDSKLKGDETGEAYWTYDSYDRGSAVLMSVRFPRSDLAIIEKRMKSHNESLRETGVEGGGGG